MANLTDHHGQLQGAIREALHYAGDGVIDAACSLDFLHDRFVLNVQHIMAERRDLEDRNYRVIAARLRRAMLVCADPTQEAKKARIERRQLRIRGKEFQDRKPRRK